MPIGGRVRVACCAAWVQRHRELVGPEMDDCAFVLTPDLGAWADAWLRVEEAETGAAYTKDNRRVVVDSIADTIGRREFSIQVRLWRTGEWTLTERDRVVATGLWRWWAGGLELATKDAGAVHPIRFVHGRLCALAAPHGLLIPTLPKLPVLPLCVEPESLVDWLAFLGSKRDS